MKYRTVLTSLLMLLILMPRSRSAPGDLDPAFDGAAAGRLRFGFGDDAASAMATQTDGKIMVAGSSTIVAESVSSAHFSMIRLNADGSPDTSFGASGKVITPIGPASGARAMRIQPDGGILLAGSTTGGDNKRNMALARYLPAGVLDGSFGSGGIVTTDAGADDEIMAMRVLADGKILVAGTGTDSSRRLLLARYLPDGSLDTTFGSGGIARPADPAHAASSLVHSATDLVVQRDGMILVSAQKGNRLAVCRLLADGRVDRSFGVDGVCAIPPEGTFVRAGAVGIQPRRDEQLGSVDRIILTGAIPGNGPSSFLTARIGMDGALDTSFDGDGYALTPVGSSYAEARALIIQSSLSPLGTNRIMVGGFSTTAAPAFQRRFTVVKYLLSGALDTAFGVGGTLTVPLGSGNGEITAMTLLSGRLLAAGTVTAGNSSDFAITARSPAAGSPDAAFDGDGIRIQDIGDRAVSPGTNVTPLADGRLAVPASPNNGAHTVAAVALMRENGSPDLSFGGDGSASVDTAEASTATVAALQADGRVLVAGTATAGAETAFLLARFLPNGDLDSSFDGDGYAVTDMGAGADSAHHIALQPDGRIIVAGKSGTSLALARYLADGSLDTGFSADGKVVTVILGAGETPADLRIQPDGKILVAATASGAGLLPRLGMIRFLATGAEDNGFGSFARVTTSVGDVSAATGLALQTDGKILLSGQTAELTSAGNAVESADAVLARYLPNGAPDPSFGGDGVVITPIGISFDYGFEVAVREGGKILMAGVAAIGEELRPALVRYLADGSPDPAYGPGGKAVSSFPIGTADTFLFLGDAPLYFDHAGRVVISGQYRILTGAAPATELKILSITRLGNGHIRLQGTGSPGGPHTLHASPSLLKDTFSPLSAITPDTGGLWRYDDTGAPAVPRRFYRLSSP